MWTNTKQVRCFQATVVYDGNKPQKSLKNWIHNCGLSSPKLFYGTLHLNETEWLK